MRKLDLLLHPVRLRIVHALYREDACTTAEICARLPDISQATVYRHVERLLAGGLLQVVSERRVRGAVERRYALQGAAAVVDRAAAATMSLDDHRHGFAAAVAALVSEFNAYLDRPGADPPADSVSYLQIPIWLSRTEV